MCEMKTTNIELVNGEVGGEWACMIACIGGCVAAGMVVPGGAALSSFATVAGLL